METVALPLWPLPGASAMAMPASVPQTRLGSWLASASTTPPAWTVSSARPSTRTGRGHVAQRSLLTNASVSTPDPVPCACGPSLGYEVAR